MCLFISCSFSFVVVFVLLSLFVDSFPRSALFCLSTVLHTTTSHTHNKPVCVCVLMWVQKIYNLSSLYLSCWVACCLYLLLLVLPPFSFLRLFLFTFPPPPTIEVSSYRHEFCFFICMYKYPLSVSIYIIFFSWLFASFSSISIPFLVAALSPARLPQLVSYTHTHTHTHTQARKRRAH